MLWLQQNLSAELLHGASEGEGEGGSFVGTCAADAHNVAWGVEIVLLHAPQNGRLKLGEVNVAFFDLCNGIITSCCSLSLSLSLSLSRHTLFPAWSAMFHPPFSSLSKCLSM